ncbi:hypothetical protein ACFQE5_18860 [Pseudonocardia hispaniensis]|uniref:Uncharacterized protein n=1 Tax=Pseudonocardia hispaniensis TaxID=904933 RepID=A0ABW1J6R1_9PSEU
MNRPDQYVTAPADWGDLKLLAAVVRDLRGRLNEAGRAVLEAVLDERGVEVER